MLEVILSLVVLGTALAMLGEVMQLANRGALDARAETQAQILAMSLMDEIAAGFVDAAAASRQPLEVDDDTQWVYSVAIGASNVEGILPVEVIVEQDLEPRFNPVRFRLVKWLPEALDVPAAQQGGAGQPAAGGAPGGAAGMGGAAGTQ